MDKSKFTEVDQAVWIETCLASLEGGKLSDEAIVSADRVLEAYRKRFCDAEDRKPFQRSLQACTRALQMMSELNLFKKLQEVAPGELDRFIKGMADDFARTVETSPITRNNPRIQTVMRGFYSGPEFPKLIKNFIRTGDAEVLTADLGKALDPYIKATI